MTFNEAVDQFKYSHSAFLEAKRDDVVAIRTAWNDYTHFLLEDGIITEEQYNTWDQPF